MADEGDWTAPGLSFGRELREDDRKWWSATFEGLFPCDVAAALTRDLPGDKTFEFELDGANASFTMSTRSNEGNSTIWYGGSEMRLRDAAFHRDGLNVTHGPHGEGLARVLVGNMADFGRPRGVARITFDAEDVGGFTWAKAGGVPTGSWELLREHVERQAIRICRIHRDIAEDEMRLVLDLVARGSDDPRIIWALAALPEVVRSHNERDAVGPTRVTLGRELLVGARWRGAIDLKDPVGEAAFEGWRAKGRGRTIDQIGLRSRRLTYDPLAIGGALAMRGVGFADAEIARTFGTMPPIDHDRETILAMVGASINGAITAA